jgi:hypothetical protein
MRADGDVIHARLWKHLRAGRCKVYGITVPFGSGLLVFMLQMTGRPYRPATERTAAALRGVHFRVIVNRTGPA